MVRGDGRGAGVAVVVAVIVAVTVAVVAAIVRGDAGGGRVSVIGMPPVLTAGTVMVRAGKWMIRLLSTQRISTQDLVLLTVRSESLPTKAQFP